MKHTAKERNWRKYVIFDPDQILLNEEQDAIGLMGICAEYEASRLILFAENLPPDFFDLKTRLAGMIFQKFINYRVQCAIVIPGSLIKGRFREMVIESNCGNNIRFFEDLKEAENWIVSF